MRSPSFLLPLVSFDVIDGDELNQFLVDHQHKMGPLHRPRYGHRGCAHGLRHEGQLVAVVATEPMTAASTCGLHREDAFELARLDRDRPGLCRVALRMWREFVFPAFAQAGGWKWAISYQDAALHSGETYRNDGWVRIGKTSSGTDPRARGGTRRGRNKVVWGWHPDPAERALRRV
jgi:antitoxin VapB